MPLPSTKIHGIFSSYSSDGYGNKHCDDCGLNYCRQSSGAKLTCGNQPYVPYFAVIFSITILFGLGASSIISFAKGRRDENQANRVFTSTFIVLIALSVIFIAIQLPLADSISSLLTKDSELKSLLYQYYVPFIIGTPIYLLLMCSIHFVRADARPAFASNIVIVANAVNLGLDFLFMGAFKMGIAGSSIATVTGYAVGFVMMSTHFIMKKSTLHFDFSILRNPVQFFKFLGKWLQSDFREH